MNLINKVLKSHSIGTKDLFVLILSMISIGCSSDSSSNSKRNSRNLFTLEIYAPQCRVEIKKTFSTQADLCQYISYELSRSNCAYNELQREFTYNNCHTQVGHNPNQGQVNDGQWDGQIDIGVLPTHPIPLDRHIEDDLYGSYQSILDYYTIDETGCFIKIIGTGIVLDDCPDKNGNIDEKDQTYRPGPVAEKDQTYTPEKDQDYSQEDVTPAKPKPTDVAAPAKPTEDETPSAPVTNKLDYNLVYYNARSFIYDEVSATRRPVLKITGRIDQKSPIYDLRHADPSVIKDIKLVDLQSACPLKSQLSTSSNTIVLTLLSAVESTADQVNACRTLFDNIAGLSGLEFSFTQPIKMTNGKTFNVPFKLVNQ